MTYGHPCQDAVSGSPGNHALFIGDLNGREYGFSLADGAQIFPVTTGKIQNSAAVSDGTLSPRTAPATPTHHQDEIISFASSRRLDDGRAPGGRRFNPKLRDRGKPIPMVQGISLCRLV